MDSWDDNTATFVDEPVSRFEIAIREERHEY